MPRYPVFVNNFSIPLRLFEILHHLLQKKAVKLLQCSLHTIITDNNFALRSTHNFSAHVMMSVVKSFRDFKHFWCKRKVKMCF